MSASPYKTTVSDAAESIDLTLLETVKLELGITGSEQDAYLATLITQASQIIATYCNRVFAQETLVDSFRLTTGSDLLMLSRSPVVSVSSVVEDGETLTADDYEFEVSTGFLWRLDGDDNRSCWAAAKIVVTHVAGYELLATLPPDIERACIKLVTAGWFAKTRDPLVKRIQIEGVSEREYWVGSVPGDNGALPAEVEALLNPYRIIAI